MNEYAKLYHEYAKLYQSLGLDCETQGAQCVAACIIYRGGTAEEAERYLRSSQWLDLRFPQGWGTTERVRSNGYTTETLYRAIVPNEV